MENRLISIDDWAMWASVVGGTAVTATPPPETFVVTGGVLTTNTRHEAHTWVITAVVE